VTSMPNYTNDTKAVLPKRSVIIALAFLVFSILILNFPTGVQQQLGVFIRGSVLRPFVITQESIVRRRVHIKATEALQQQLDSISSILSSQNNLTEENDRLRKLLNLPARSLPNYVAASVVRPGIQGSEGMFLLDVGRDQGVIYNSPVIMGQGLVGVVKESRDNNSLGMDWTHPEFRVSAMTLDGTVYGIIQANQEVFRESYRLLIDGIPFYQELDPGTILVTSSLGGVYPRGIPIGTVVEQAESRAGWRRSYWLRPFVFPGEAMHVLVLASREKFEYVTDIWFQEELMISGNDSVNIPRRKDVKDGQVGDQDS